MAPFFSLVATVCLVAATSAWSLAPRADGDLCSLNDQRVAIVGNRLFFMGGQYIFQGGTPSSQQSLSWIYLNESFPVEVTISPNIIHSVPVPDHVPVIIDNDFWSDNTTLYLPAGWAVNETATPGSIWSFNTSTDQWKELPVQGGDFNFGQRENPSVASVPLHGLSFFAGGRTIPMGGLLMLDSSDPAKLNWKNLTDGNGTSGSRIPLSLEGEMAYVRAGNRGLLVTFGGYDTSHNGTQFGAGWLWDQRAMDQITVYDIESTVAWDVDLTSPAVRFTVTATGDIPSKRTRTCTTVSSSPDDSSFQITMYGGWDLANNVAFEDVYVLAIPAFVWIKISDINNGESQSGKVGRHGAKCKLWGNREMVVLGGLVYAEKDPVGGGYLNRVSCNPAYPPIRILDTTTFTWKTNLDTRPSYTVPSAVYKVIGGDASGKATLSRQVRGSNAGKLDDVLSKRVPLIPDPLPAAAASPTSTRVPTPPPLPNDHTSTSNTPAIAGGAVGGLCALGVVIGILVVMRRRRRRRAADRRTPAAEGHDQVAGPGADAEYDSEGWMKPELSSDSAAPPSSSAPLLAVPGSGPRFELAGSADDGHQPVLLKQRSISDVSTIAPPLPVKSAPDLAVAEMAGPEPAEVDDTSRRVVELEDSSAITPLPLPPPPPPPSRARRSDDVKGLKAGPPPPPSPSPPPPFSRS
ncbi:MAG: hypothetical protein M1826_006531 [Phylliscum demangeonii]|nr:MAG: hypothetical protein M1826_006531 [Phylliscum demangeonii]